MNSQRQAPVLIFPRPVGYGSPTSLVDEPSTASKDSILQAVWTNPILGMRVTDENGIIVAASKKYCEMINRNPLEIVGNLFFSDYDTFHSPEVMVRAYRRKFRKASKTPLGESGINIPFGSDKFYDVESTPITIGTNQALLLSIFRETTGGRDSLSALKESEQRLRWVLQEVRDVIFTIDREGILTSINLEFERKTGWSPEEWLGKSFHPLLHPDDIRVAWKSFRGVLHNGETVGVELRVRAKNGCYLDGEFTMSPEISNGKVTGVLGAVRDITERKKNEEKGKQEQVLLRTLIDNIPDLIYFKDSEGRYLLNNRSHLNSLGMTDLQQTLGKTTFDFHPSDLAQRYHADEMQIIKTKKPLVNREEWAIHRDTGERRLHLTGKFPLIDAAGKVTGIVGISRDITEQKHVEEALLQSEAKYRSLFANSVQPMFQTSVEGEFLNGNDALLKLLKYDNFFELRKIRVGDLYVRPEERNEIRKVVEEKEFINGAEIDLKTRDGKIVTVVEYSRALRDENGTLCGFEGILEDITTRKAMQLMMNQYLKALEGSQKELARLNAEKDKLFSVLSHDLRSPFGSILGFCEILLNEGSALTEEEKTQFITYIQEGAQDQLSLVNRLLDWSRLESGRVKMELKELDLAAIAERCVTNLLGIAKKKEVTLSSALEPGLKVHADEEFLKQVFENLIGNSLKFTPANGFIVVGLETKTDSEIVVTVRDTGAGIPESDIPKLFKVEEKYTRKGLGGEKGTGLGLSVCAEVMQKLGGTIRAESTVGKGTTFYLTFPNNTPKEGMNILIADDEEGARILHSRYIKRILPEARILFASNGREALEQATKHQPTAIITDYAMPEMDGYEMLVELKKTADIKGIPVLVITGEDSKASKEAMLLSGASAVFSKPVVPDTLELELKKVISGV